MATSRGSSFRRALHCIFSRWSSMDILDPSVRPAAATVARPERVFPTLTAQQVSRVAAHGRRRATVLGEVLVEGGDRTIPFFVVVSGELQVVRPSDAAETLI